MISMEVMILYGGLLGVGAFSAIIHLPIRENHYLIQIYKQRNFMDEKKNYTKLNYSNFFS